MAVSESLDFSGLFKIETLVQTSVRSSCIYELGLQKLIAIAGKEALDFLYINSIDSRVHKTCNWDFGLHPIRCMCFEPTGTWLLAVSDRNLSLVPYLPVFETKSNYDHKWSLEEPTVIPFNTNNAVSVAWWLTKTADNIAVIAQMNGAILFYSMDTKSIVGETKVQNNITDLQIVVDDDLDLIVLLIIGGYEKQWKLILEHRSVDYIWTREHTVPTPEVKEKKEGIMAYLTDKISTFTQGNPPPDKVPPAWEYSRDPIAYLPSFRKDTHTWSLCTQYVDGRHFITALDVKSKRVILENTKDTHPVSILYPRAKDSGYQQALWSSRLLFLLTENSVEVHSTSFSTMQDPTSAPPDDTLLWRAELPCRLTGGRLAPPRGAPRPPSGWCPPTFLCDLRLERFSLEPCLLVGTEAVFLLTAMTDPSEWLVGAVTRGGRGVERAAAALAAPVDSILRAAADMLLSRGKIPPAKYLYLLSKSPAEGWQVRLGVFGLVTELANYKCETIDLQATPSAGSAVMIKLLAQVLILATCPQVDSAVDIHVDILTPSQLEELCDLAATLGLWEVLSSFSLHKGYPQFILTAINSRKSLCEATLKYLLRQKCIQPYLLEVDARFLYKYLKENCRKFDTVMLKRFCVWLSPLSEQLRPVLRDLKLGINNIYTSRMKELISAFIHLAGELDSREPSVDMPAAAEPQAQSSEPFVSKRSLSCGLKHWAIVEDGEAVVMAANTEINPGLIGRVLSVSCGRHHTLVLTENGLYASGDNSRGQLGVGRRWAGLPGEAASANGALLHVRAPSAHRVTSVTAGQYHSALLDATGRLYTWGWGVHGQLGLGNTDDALEPQLVTALQEHHVVSVGCGACHTVALTAAREVYVTGAGALGQTGGGALTKTSVPTRLALADVTAIAVGYFHNLALTSTGELWRWGASPQMVRSAVPLPRRTAPPAPSDPPPDVPPTHLSPTLVDTSDVVGKIVQMSAGWHHSCLLTHLGRVYTWGLNFDRQLGTNDRRQVPQPQLVEIPPENMVDDVKNDSLPISPRQEVDPLYTTKALVACGGAFTVYVNDHGKIFIAGNMNEQNEKGKHGNKIIMMKTTRRVIKIPANKHRFRFQYLDSYHNLLPPGGDHALLPLTSEPAAARGSAWLGSSVQTLSPWIEEQDVAAYPNVASKLAFHNKRFADCLKYQLENISNERTESEPAVPEGSSIADAKSKKISKGLIATTIKTRIKEIGMAYLNEQPFPELASDIYGNLTCGCEDLPKTEKNTPFVKQNSDLTKDELALLAAKIIDNSLKTFPASAETWEVYLSLAKQFFVKHGLPCERLEEVLTAHIEKNRDLISSAVLFSDDCATYEKLFTPGFYLSLCKNLLNSSG